MVKTLVDAGGDAIFGWLSTTRGPASWPRRPFILVGGILAGIGLPLMFAVGTDWTEGGFPARFHLPVRAADELLLHALEQP